MESFVLEIIWMDWNYDNQNQFFFIAFRLLRFFLNPVSFIGMTHKKFKLINFKIISF